jgi:hypothetical protein
MHCACIDNFQQPDWLSTYLKGPCRLATRKLAPQPDIPDIRIPEKQEVGQHPAGSASCVLMDPDTRDGIVVYIVIRWQNSLTTPSPEMARDLVA